MARSRSSVRLLAGSPIDSVGSMLRSVLVCSALLGLLGLAACSNEGAADPVDVDAVLDDHDDLTAKTDELLGASSPTTGETRSAAIGRAVAALVEDLATDDASSRVRLTGELLGATSAVLADLASDGDDDDRAATVDYAIRLAAEASGHRPGLPVDEGLEWIVPAGVDAELRASIGAALDDRRFAEMSQLVVDETDLTGADVIDEVIEELSGLVTVQIGDDQLTIFLQAVSRGRTRN